MTPAQIAETLAILSTPPVQRPTISTSSCTAPGCTACAKGGHR